MTRAAADAGVRRAARLLRWYPRSWRDRYGEEFTELLLDEFAEQPRSPRLTANVIGTGLLTRLTAAGLTSHELPADQHIRAGLATFGCALAASVTLGVAQLAQLATGWQWASPRSASAAGGTVAMALAVGCLVGLGLAAAVPVAWCVCVAVVRGRGRGIAWPAALTTGSALALLVGTRHFQNSWPGTGGTGAEHGLVPAGAAAFGWASTLSVSSFWAHPALLASFPAPELAWMAASPVAGIGLVAGLVLTLRRIALPARLLTYLARLAVAATLPAMLLLAGAASWVLGHGPGQAGLFRPGLVDGAGLLVMALALIVALRAAAGIRHASRTLTRSRPGIRAS